MGKNWTRLVFNFKGRWRHIIKSRRTRNCTGIFFLLSKNLEIGKSVRKAPKIDLNGPPQQGKIFINVPVVSFSPSFRLRKVFKCKINKIPDSSFSVAHQKAPVVSFNTIHTPKTLQTKPTTFQKNQIGYIQKQLNWESIKRCQSRNKKTPFHYEIKINFLSTKKLIKVSMAHFFCMNKCKIN